MEPHAVGPECVIGSSSAAAFGRFEQIFQGDESTRTARSTLPGGRAVDVDVRLARSSTRLGTRKETTGPGISKNDHEFTQTRSLWDSAFWSSPLVVSEGLLVSIELAVPCGSWY